MVLETGHYYGDRLGGIILADFTVSPPEDYTEWGRRAEREGKTRARRACTRDIETALAPLPTDSGTAVPASVRGRLHRASVACGPVEGGWTWKFDPALFDHLEMGADQRDKFVTLQCRSALILGEHSEDSGAQSAATCPSITDGILPIVTIPETFHHMMFDEPLATAMAIKAFVLAGFATTVATTTRRQRSPDIVDRVCARRLAAYAAANATGGVNRAKDLGCRC